MIIKVFYSRKYNQLVLADVRGFNPQRIEILGSKRDRTKGVMYYIKKGAVPKSYIYVGDYE